MSVRVCQGCGGDLPPKTWRGRDRKWCSDRCRKSQYSVPCIDCGKPLNGSDGRGPNAPTRCQKCNGEYIGAQSKVWTREAIIAAIREWAAEHDGVYPSTLAWWPHHARTLGCEPHPDYLSEPGRWPCWHTVYHEFGGPGGWRRAIEAAGFTPREPGRTLAQMRAAA